MGLQQKNNEKQLCLVSLFIKRYEYCINNIYISLFEKNVTNNSATKIRFRKKLVKMLFGASSKNTHHVYERSIPFVMSKIP